MGGMFNQGPKGGGKNNGGKGGGKGGGKKPPKRKRSPEFKEARRDVMLAFNPYKRELKRTMKQGTQDYRMMSDKMANVYGALDRTVAGLPGADYAGISNQLSGDVGNLSSLLGSQVPLVPGEEMQAGLGVVGSIGAGGLTNIASQAARAGDYSNSVRTQGGIENVVGQRNALHELLNFKDDIRQQRLDAARDLPSLIRQRMSELRDQKFEQSLALQQLALDRLKANRDFGLSNRSLDLQAASDAATAEYLRKKAQLEARRGKGKGGKG